jgi:hypothetical protein
VVLAGLALVALFFTGRIPDRQPGSVEPDPEREPVATG